MSASRTLVVVMGILGGVGGMVHGAAEILKGDVPTEGFLLSSVGAFTVIPSYQATGIAAVILGMAVTLWTVGFVHKRHGPLVFLALFLALFLVGGGVAQVPLFLIAWGVSTRIGKPLSWWESALSARSRVLLSALWLPLLCSALGCLLAGMLIWMILLPPGVQRQISVAHYVCWSLLGLSLLLFPAAVVAGFARDLERRSR
jgi:hypothetical protein